MKKDNFIIIALILFIILMIALSIYYIVSNKDTTNHLNNNEIVNNVPNESEIQTPPTDKTDGNDTIISTNSDTKLRYINNYTTQYFTADKNLLLMFGSWCSHCKSEMPEVEKILKYYENNKDINIILIAHEYDDTISNLISLVENDVEFGKREVFIDLKRIIRKTIDSEANTVPISYVVDKNGKVLQKNDGVITLDIAKDMLK